MLIAHRVHIGDVVGAAFRDDPVFCRFHSGKLGAVAAGEVPVSYTHLWRVQREAACDGEMRQLDLRQAPAEVEYALQLVHDAGAVSYTHLDVYKRQAKILFVPSLDIVRSHLMCGHRLM